MHAIRRAVKKTARGTEGRDRCWQVNLRPSLSLFPQLSCFYADSELCNVLGIASSSRETQQSSCQTGQNERVVSY